MISDDAKDAAKVDQQLDEAEEVQAEEEPTRLWWETNPELSERFRRS
ncbi:hypothetical protein [Fodinicola feengrottensis]|nr:hypothetical protein [Fodinicola feengrottensis]